MDIWAAGCVLYEMATLRPLFDGRDENEQMQKIDRVLGSPSYGMISKFEKYKSDLLVTRYDTGNRSEWVVTVGVGLHAVYQSFRPAYELLKEMIVYDPNKRFSAGQLLRKPYFNDMKNTRYEYKIKKFRAMVKRNNAAVSGWCTGEGSVSRLWDVQETVEYSGVFTGLQRSPGFPRTKKKDFYIPLIFVLRKVFDVKYSRYR